LVVLADPRLEDLLFVVDPRRVVTLGTARALDLMQIGMKNSAGGKTSAVVKITGAGKRNDVVKKIIV
jgi:hypothetical protein